MNNVAHYLQEHLVGEATASPDVRRYFAHDASIVSVVPAAVVYPRSENDVRKTARFAWQLAERGKIVPLTSRGLGSDTSGGAVGSGIMLVFAAHLNRILTLDPRRKIVDIEPGINYDKLQQTLFTHGLFLPPYPASLQYCTVGGAIANNASGEKSFKYGDTRAYVNKLRVVLSNGEAIETGRINKRELNRKMGLSSFEGEIYRSLDALIEENQAAIKTAAERLRSARNAAGYGIFDVKRKDGSFDLTPLLVGSQGTLGIITEAQMRLETHNPLSKTALLTLQSLEQAPELLSEILKLKPSMFEVVNGELIDQVMLINPNMIDGILPSPKATLVVLVEFDDEREGRQSKALKKLSKLATKYHASCQMATGMEAQERLLSIRRSVGTLVSHSGDRRRMVPVADDIAVPLDRFVETIARMEQIYRDNGLPAALWGHAGDGVIRSQPALDLGQLGDRQRLFKLADEIYRLAIEQGGTITAAFNDGRVRSPYLSKMFDENMMTVFQGIKKIFDPYNILNPGVKLGTTMEGLKASLKNEYTLGHRLEHMPRT